MSEQKKPTKNVDTLSLTSTKDILRDPIAAELWLSAIIESADDAIISKRLDGIITSWNKGAEIIFGYSAAEMIGEPIAKLFPSDRLDEETQIIEKIKRGEKIEHFETVRIRKDGNQVEISLTVSPIKAADGTILGVSKIAREITDRKRIEKALGESEELYRIVAETASDAIISINERSEILFINRAATRIFGYEVEQMIGQSLTMLMPEYWREIHKAGFNRYLTTGERHLSWDHVEVPGLHSDGYEIPLELSFGEFATADQHIFIGIARDVSERKKSEARLRESEIEFSTLAETVPQLVWMAEANGSIFWYNRNWYEYTGTTPDEMKGWGWQTVHDPQMLSQVVERWQKSIATGEPFEMEFPLRSKTGEFRWFLTRVNPLRDASGKIARWFGTNTDIDEQRRNNERQNFLLRLDEAVRPLDTPEEVSQTIARMLGEHLRVDRCAYAEVEADENHFYISGDYTRDGDTRSIVGRYAISSFGAEVLRLLRENKLYIVDDVNNDPQVTKEDLAAYRQMQIRAIISMPLHKNGRLAASMAVHQKQPRKWTNEEIELVGIVSNRFWESIERARTLKSLQESLAHEQDARQAAEDANRLKDEFLATVSHELRTPLNAILGWSQMLQNKNLSKDLSEKALSTIERNARMQSQLIDDILDVSRIITGKLRLDVRAVDLADVIEAAIETVRPAAEAKNIRLQSLFDSHVEPISGDRDRLQQVVWNLLSNAVKFTPKEGRVQIRLERINSRLEITVSDTGKGIEPDFLPYVFDRFRQSDSATTRRHGGLGLGLAIVRQIVELHGGTVSVMSEGGNHGSTFIVCLPLLPVRNEIINFTNKKAAAGRLHQKNLSIDCLPELSDLRVLLVDDEADSRELLKIILDNCEADVTTASSAAEAFELFQNSRFDIIISDIGMPDEDGFSLIRKIRKLSAERGGKIPAIALTAYARAEDRQQALRAGFQMHVAKPVEPDELLTVVANLAGRFSN